MKTIFQTIKVQLKFVKKISAQPVHIGSSLDVYEFLKANMDWSRANGQEFAYLICLSRNNEVTAFHELSVGGFNSTVVDPKVVFATALLAAASTIILAYNHPSGNLNPSEEDYRITKRLTEAGKALTLPLIDHLIVTEAGYYSFAEEGKL